MPESEQAHENLASVRTHMERIEQLVRFQILANKQNADAVLERLTGRAGMAEAYLAIGADGPRTQEELAASLGKSQPTVSRIVKELYDAGLVIKVPSLGNRQVMAYAWSDLEPLIGVSRIARRLLTDTPAASADARGQDGVRQVPSRTRASTSGAPPQGRGTLKSMRSDDTSTLSEKDDDGRESAE